MKRLGWIVGYVIGITMVWTVLASSILCFQSGAPELFVMPYAQWWTFAPVWFGANWWVSLWIVLSGLGATIGVLMFSGVVYAVWRFRRRGPRHLKRNKDGSIKPFEYGITDNHGHARWPTPEELAARFPKRGCLIGSRQKGNTLDDLIFDNIDTGPRHNMIIAGPGSDKTTSSISRIWLWNGPRVVFDPSCEIGPIMRQAFKDTHHNVIEIGMRDAEHPERGGLNILDWIDITHPTTNQRIRSVVEWIYNEKTGNNHSVQSASHDPYWGQRGREMVTCFLAHILFADEGTAPKNMRTLRKFISTPEKQMPELFRGIHERSNSPMARDLAGTFMAMTADQTFSSILSNAAGATEWLADPVSADVVSGSSMNTADILDPRTVVFIQIPLRDLQNAPGMGRAIMGSLFNAVFEADGASPHCVLFAIDEARILGPHEGISLCHATARKYNACISTLWQSEAQIQETWGRNGAIIMQDTCAWRSYNAIQNGQIAENISRDIGKTGVAAYSESTNNSLSKPWGFNMGSSTAGDNTNLTEIGRRLISGDEILRSPADTLFVLTRDFGYPVKAYTAPYYRYPAIDKLMNLNRFVRKTAPWTQNKKRWLSVILNKLWPTIFGDKLLPQDSKP